MTKLDVLCLCLTLTTGCEGLKERGKYLTGADAFEWHGDRFTIHGKKEMWGQLNTPGDKVDLFVQGFPPGTTVTLGGGKVTVRDDGYGALTVAMSSLLGDVAFGKPEDVKLDHMSMMVQAPGASPFEVKLPVESNLALENVWGNVTKGPVLFGAEAADQTGPPRNIVWVDWIKGNPVFGPTPATFKGVDGLALVKRLAGPTKVCTGYKGDDGMAAPDIKLRVSPAEVTIYARRTGRVIAQKTFPASDSCPVWASGAKDKALDRDSALPETDVKAWLESQLAASP